MFLPTIARPIAYPPAKLYEWIVRARLSLYRTGRLATRALGAPVISVGNLTVGGTGKTPCTAFLARMLRGEGLDVAILSRGYRRSSRGRIEVSDGQRILCSAADAGDEPYLLAQSCPGVRVVADSDRYAAGRWLEERARVSVFLLDDGYQHLRLARAANLLLMDGAEPLAGMRMVPFGRLREPLAGIARADAVIVTRSDALADRAEFDAAIRRYARPGTPIFYAHHVLASLTRLDRAEEASSLAALAGRPVAAVSGIARPERFFDDLAAHAMRLTMRRAFADHHRYADDELRRLLRDAAASGADALLTTEKDAANLPVTPFAEAPLPVYAVRLRFDVERADALRDLLLASVRSPGA